MKLSISITNFCLLLLGIFIGTSLNDLAAQQPVYTAPVFHAYSLAGGSFRTPACNSFMGYTESVLLNVPAKPLKLKRLIVYFQKDGFVAQSTQLKICGSPAWTIHPSPAVWDYPSGGPLPTAYNTLATIDVTVTTSGYKTFDLSSYNLYSDGYDKFFVQHLINNCISIGTDRDGRGSGSKLFNPYPYNSPTSVPDALYAYYNAMGDFKVSVEYEYVDINRVATPTIPTAPIPTFSDVAVSKGLSVGGYRVASKYISVADWNKDSYDDVFIGGHYYQNNCGANFTEVTGSIGLPTNREILAWADFDNDGDLDVIAARNHSLNEVQVYRNDGIALSPTHFTLYSGHGISNTRPVSSMVWLDYNNDGLLDLYIANGRSTAGGVEVHYADRLFKQNIPNTTPGFDAPFSFTEVTLESGIGAGEDTDSLDCWSANACDYNKDDKPDIFVANYRLRKDFLYKNNGSNGTTTTFTQTQSSLATGVAGTTAPNGDSKGHGIAGEWGDLNNDLWDDLVVSNLAHPDERGFVSTPSLIYINPQSSSGEASFAEVHRPMGLKYLEYSAGVTLFDIDNNGTLDLWQSNHSYEPSGNDVPRVSAMYRNDKNPVTNEYKLRDMTWFWGCEMHGAWASARLDYDQDGDMDLLVSNDHEGTRLFRNHVAPTANKWIGIRLEGSPAHGVNRNAYGSHVTITAGGIQQHRYLNGAGGTSGSQNSNEIHFGLGNIAASTVSIEIRYPNGQVCTLSAATNGHYKIVYQGGTNATISPITTCTPGSGKSDDMVAINQLTAQPNPFSEETQIQFITQNNNEHALLKVYDLTGREVATLFNGTTSENTTYAIPLTVEGLATGIYLVQLVTDDGHRQTIKLMVRGK